MKLPKVIFPERPKFLFFQAKYKQAEEKMKAHKAERESKMEEKFSNLSEEAKKHFAKVKEIKNNLSLTRAQARQQIKNLFEALPEKVKEEVKGVFPCHDHGDGHDHGAHHGAHDGGRGGHCHHHHQHSHS